MGKHVILGASWCPYCVRVYDYFRNKGIPFEDVNTEGP